MPYLKLKTNLELDKQQSPELLAKLSKLMASETSKPERYVMAELSSGHDMLFAGSDAPLAYLECKSIGLTSTQAKSISSAVTQLLNADLQVDADRIYIEFSSCSGEFWGWNGGTFA